MPSDTGSMLHSGALDVSVVVCPGGGALSNCRTSNGGGVRLKTARPFGVTSMWVSAILSVTRMFVPAARSRRNTPVVAQHGSR
jgi:hypothetical protein